MSLRKKTAPLILVLFWVSFSAWAQSPDSPERGSQRQKPQVVTASKAMVVTANPHASRAALATLKKGGNAMDAIAAAQLVLNVVEPQSSGIGGGGFLLYYHAKAGQVVVLDGREEAPSSARQNMFLDKKGAPVRFYPDRVTGGKPVGVPGLVKMLEKGLRRYGQRGWARAFDRAKKLAAQGISVSPRLAAQLKLHQKRLARFPATKKIFFRPDGSPLQAGDKLIQKDLSQTFALLASKGSKVFYKGEIARDLRSAISQSPVNPGKMTAKDLSRYDAPSRKPVTGQYKGYTIYGAPPPSSGGVTLTQILNILEAGPAKGGVQGANQTHYFVQAVQLAYADRNRYLGDPDFIPLPLAGLLDKTYTQKRANSLDWGSKLKPASPGRPRGVRGAMADGQEAEGLSTTHLVVVDRNGNIASLTSSLEVGFGSGLVVPGRGFLLNNQLTDFSSLAKDAKGRLVANRIVGTRGWRKTALDGRRTLGGKRPLSSMAPTLVMKGKKPVLVLGSPGGTRIIQYVARVILDVLEGGKSLQKAIESPHITHMKGKTFLEKGFSWGGLPETLEKKGHQVKIVDQTSGLHGVHFVGNRMVSGVDPRREGMALGY